jgi:hypothetical protein
MHGLIPQIAWALVEILGITLWVVRGSVMMDIKDHAATAVPNYFLPCEILHGGGGWVAVK